MAQYVNQYVAELLKRQRAVAQEYPDLIPIDPLNSNRSVYGVNLMTLIIIGVVMKKISEVAPQVDDAAWIDALNHAIDGPWPDWIVNQDPNNIT